MQIKELLGFSFLRFGFYNFAYLLIGFIISLLIFYVLIVPSITTSNAEIIAGKVKEIEELVNELKGMSEEILVIKTEARIRQLNARLTEEYRANVTINDVLQ